MLRRRPAAQGGDGKGKDGKDAGDDSSGRKADGKEHLALRLQEVRDGQRRHRGACLCLSRPFPPSPASAHSLPAARGDDAVGSDFQFACDSSMRSQRCVLFHYLLLNDATYFAPLARMLA